MEASRIGLSDELIRFHRSLDFSRPVTGVNPVTLVLARACLSPRQASTPIGSAPLMRLEPQASRHALSLGQG